MGFFSNPQRPLIDTTLEDEQKKKRKRLAANQRGRSGTLLTGPSPSLGNTGQTLLGNAG